MNITNNLWNKSSYTYNPKSSPNSLTNFMHSKQENIENNPKTQIPPKSMGLSNFNNLQNLLNKNSMSHVNSNLYVYKEKSLLSKSVDESDNSIENETLNDNDEKLNIEVTRMMSGVRYSYNGLGIEFHFPEDLDNIHSFDIIKTHNGLEFKYYDENHNEIPDSSSKMTFDELRDLGVPNEAIDALLSNLYDRPFGIFQYTPSYYKDEKDKDEKDVYTMINVKDIPSDLCGNSGTTDYVVQLY